MTGCWPGVDVLHTAGGRVGSARAAGVAALLQAEAGLGTPPQHVWIASTDADSAVPRGWLCTQLQHARAGVEMVLGTVRPDPQELADGLPAAWRLRHLITDGHPHVHGSNLGIRADIYLAAGVSRMSPPTKIYCSARPSGASGGRPHPTWGGRHGVAGVGWQAWGGKVEK